MPAEVKREKPADILSLLKFEVESKNEVKDKVMIGEKIEWNLEITNSGLDFPAEMELYDEENGYLMQIKKLKTGESQLIKIGPIAFHKEEQV